MHRDLWLFLVSAGLLALAFPPFKLGVLSYWAVIPFVFLIKDKTPGWAFRWGFLIGMVLGVSTMHWFEWQPGVLQIITILYHSLFYGIFSIAVVLIKRLEFSDYYLFIVPFLWTLMEMVKATGKLGLSWVTLGYTQASWLSLLPFTSGSLIYVASFWVVSINMAFIGLWLAREDTRRLIFCGVFLIGLYILPYVLKSIFIPENTRYHEKIFQAFAA